jgi:hypothetical protein
MDPTCGHTGSDSSSSSSRGGSSRFAVVDAVPFSCAAQLQFRRVQQQLQPLKDVTAVREIYLQQQQKGPAIPVLHLQEWASDALDAVCEERQQRRRLQQQVQMLTVQHAKFMEKTELPAAAAAAEGSGRPGRTAPQASGNKDDGDEDDDMLDHNDGNDGNDDDDDDDEVMDTASERSFDTEAVELLSAAAEDFMVQQFQFANQLALHAGRQEVTAADLRMALATSGYSHMLPSLRQPVATDAAADDGLKGLMGMM